MVAAWYQERGAGVEPGGIAGRSWYTGLGHCVEIWRASQIVVTLQFSILTLTRTNSSWDTFWAG